MLFELFEEVSLRANSIGIQLVSSTSQKFSVRLSYLSLVCGVTSVDDMENFEQHTYMKHQVHRTLLRGPRGMLLGVKNANRRQRGARHAHRMRERKDSRIRMESFDRRSPNDTMRAY